MFRLALRIVLSVLAAAPAYAGTTVRLFFPDAPAERGQGENRNPETP